MWVVQKETKISEAETQVGIPAFVVCLGYPCPKQGYFRFLTLKIKSWFITVSHLNSLLGNKPNTIATTGTRGNLETHKTPA